VINLSLGRPVMESYALDPLCQAVERAWRAGIAVVVAAGNNGRDNSMGTNGYGTITSPGNSPFAITVGAMNDNLTATKADDVIATYSSKGPSLIDHVAKPDLVAPGNRIVSALVTNGKLTAAYPSNVVPVSYYSSQYRPVSYFRLSGTSMATPMVAGAAALIVQKDPSVSPDTVKARLMKTASKTFPTISSWTDSFTGITYTSQYDLFTVGAGYLDVWAALNASETVPAGTYALSPEVIRDPVTGTVRVNSNSIVWGNSVVWGNSIVWGNSVVWGSNAFLSGTSIVWGSSVVWGNSAISGNSIVWGNSVVWGNTAPFAEALSVKGDE
jgi:serine protease AprX